MASKWNWGKSVVVAIVLFFGIWAGLVIFAFNQKVDLVTPNYYEQELKYQQEINKQQNSHSLTDKVKIELTEQGVLLQFPIAEVGRAITGDVVLYRPSDSAKDKKFPITLDSTGSMLIGLKNFRTGFYKVKVQWSTPTQNYFNEESINL